MSELREQFEAEVKKIREDVVFSPAYRRRKLISYAIRTILAIVLYVVLWRYEWFRWTLLFYIPLNLFGLFAIFGGKYLLNRKIEKTRRKIDEAEAAMVEEETSIE